MNENAIFKTLALVALGVFLAVGSAVSVQADDDSDSDSDGRSSIAGSYLAQLDLGAFGAPRIEALGVYLDENGGVLFASEHEADRESAGVGVWESLGRGKITMGVLSFRFGPDPASSACGLVGLTSPPDNCFLKVGGTLTRQSDGSFVGELFLTIETLDGAVVFALPGDPPFPISMRRLTLGDFPGTTP